MYKSWYPIVGKSNIRYVIWKTAVESLRNVSCSCRTVQKIAVWPGQWSKSDMIRTTRDMPKIDRCLFDEAAQCISCVINETTYRNTRKVFHIFLYARPFKNFFSSSSLVLWSVKYIRSGNLPRRKVFFKIGRGHILEFKSSGLYAANTFLDHCMKLLWNRTTDRMFIWKLSAMFEQRSGQWFGLSTLC